MHTYTHTHSFTHKHSAYSIAQTHSIAHTSVHSCTNICVHMYTPTHSPTHPHPHPPSHTHKHTDVGTYTPHEQRNLNRQRHTGREAGKMKDWGVSTHHRDGTGGLLPPESARTQDLLAAGHNTPTEENGGGAGDRVMTHTFEGGKSKRANVSWYERMHV